jgi:hypothetical protein
MTNEQFQTIYNYVGFGPFFTVGTFIISIVILLVVLP